MKGFVQIPGFVLARSDLTLKEKCVYGYIHGWCMHGRQQKFTGSNQLIATTLGIGRASVDRAIKRLEKLNFIMRLTASYNGAIRKREISVTSIIERGEASLTVMLDEAHGDAGEPHSDVRSEPHGEAEEHYSKNTNKNTRGENPPPESVVEWYPNELTTSVEPSPVNDPPGLHPSDMLPLNRFDRETAVMSLCGGDSKALSEHIDFIGSKMIARGDPPCKDSNQAFHKIKSWLATDRKWAAERGRKLSANGKTPQTATETFNSIMEDLRNG